MKLINCISVRQTESTYGLLEVHWMYKTKDLTFYFNSSSRLLQGEEVRQCFTYKRKESIGSNVLHTIGVQLSPDFGGGTPKPGIWRILR